MSRQLKAEDTIKNTSSIWFLIIGISAVTLYFNTKAYDPFNTPKLIISLIISGWLLGHIFNHYRIFHSQISKKEFIYLLIPSLFILAQLFALFFTDVFLVGLIGDIQRRNGFLAYLALVVILVFCIIKINYYHALRIMKMAILTGGILSIYGLMQINGNDFVAWNNPYNSMIATLGNPNFASSLLALIALISFFSFFNKQFSTLYRIIAVGVVAASIWLIIDSQSRQGLLVMAFAVLFCFTTYIYFNYIKLRIIALGFSFLLGLIAVLGMLQIGPLSSILYKDSLTVRGFYWRAAWKMFTDNPFTGIGLDRYGAYFKEYREPGYSLNYGFDITSSNAHNVYLQLFSTGGLFVGLSYLALLTLIFNAGIQNIKRTTGDTQKFNLLILSTWIGFQSQAMISIDNIGISIWGWILSGCILGINLNSSNEVLIGYVKKDNKTNKINIFQPFISTLFLIPIIIFSYNLHRIETYTFVAKSYADVSSPQNAKTVYSHAKFVMNNPLADPYYKLLVSLYISDMGYANEGYRSLISLHDNDPRNLDVIRVLAEYEKSNKNLKNEINYRLEIMKLDPWNAANYFDLGLLYKQQGNSNEVLKMREKILSFASNTDIAIKAKAELN